MKYFLEDIEEELANQIRDTLGIKDAEVVIESANPKIGTDFAIPCFSYSKQLKSAPNEIAEGLAKSLKHNEISKIEPTGGFVNIWLDPKKLYAQLDLNFEGSTNYGQNSDFKDQKVVIEFSDPNAFKPLHIGHIYSTVVGDALANLYESAGAKVSRITYGGDVGLHVAKAVYGLQIKLTADGKEISDIDDKQGPEFLGEAYVLGNKAYEDGSGEAEIIELNKALYKNDPSLKVLYDTGKRWSIDHFEDVYRQLRVDFKNSYWESQVVEAAQASVEEALDKKILVKSDGAIIFEAKDESLHTRVFRTSEGLVTYEAKDLGLAELKNQEFDYDQSIILTANEQTAYFKVVLEVLKQLRPKLSEATKHLSHGYVKLSSGKMSSREGNVILGQQVLDDVLSALKKQQPDSPAHHQNQLGAIKFALLKQNISGDVVFDVDESISLEGKSGPYIQYAAVRINSILEKAPEVSDKFESYDFEPEAKLLVAVMNYPKIVRSALEALEPHQVALYLYDLAKEFNRYYENTPVLDVEIEVTSARVKVLGMVLEVFDQGLDLLGIPRPDKM